jgi:hypothetical protein
MECNEISGASRYKYVATMWLECGTGPRTVFSPTHTSKKHSWSWTKSCSLKQPKRPSPISGHEICNDVNYLCYFDLSWVSSQDTPIDLQLKWTDEHCTVQLDLGYRLTWQSPIRFQLFIQKVHCK